MLIVIALVAHREIAPRRIAWGFVSLLLATLVMFNLGYLCEGTGARAGDYKLASGSMSRIVGHLPPWLRIPLPSEAILGFDLLKWEAEQGYQVFIFGQTYLGSKWYYFLVALALKMPVATIAIVIAAIVSMLRRRVSAQHAGECRGGAVECSRGAVRGAES